MVENEIAQAGVRVSFGARLANVAFGTDVVSRKQIIADLVKVKFGELAIPKTGPSAARFITGAALTGTTEDKE